MKHLIILLSTFALLQSAWAENDPVSTFYKELKKVEAKYRASKAKQLKKADRVIIYLVDFESKIDVHLDPFSDTDKAITIIDYKRKTEILDQKELNKKQRESILNSISKQVEKPKHSGGAMCHYPIHGIRIYKDDEILYEGTFCWACQNFSFNYPQGYSWLDTTPELYEIFNKLMPIPKRELDRFNKKFPIKKGKTNKEKQPK